MKLADIARRVGAGLVRDLVPGGAALLGVANAFLPPEYRLQPDATGQDLGAAVPALPPELQEQDFEVQLEQVRQQGDTLRTMLEADAASPHTTRPYIARGAFHVCALATVVTVSAWAWGIIAGDAAVVAAVVEGWPFVLAVTGPHAVLLRAYFGILRQEQAQRLAAAAGSPAPTMASILGEIIAKRKGPGNG